MPPVNKKVEQLIEEIGYGWFQVRLLMLCAVGYFACNAELLLTIFLEHPLMDKFGLTTDDFAFLIFSVNLVSFLTATVCGVLADRIGRRLFFMFALVFVAVFGLCSAFVQSWGMFILFRSLVAIGIGGLSVIDYVMFIECTPNKRRGTFSMILFFLGCCGTLYVAGMSLLNLENALFGIVTEYWRVLTIYTALPTVLTIVLRFWFSEETPHYLIAKGKYAEAHAVLVQMAADNKSGIELPSVEELIRIAEDSGDKAGPPPGQVQEVLKYKQQDLTFPLIAIWFLQSVAYWGFTQFLPIFFFSAGIKPNLLIFFMVLSQLPGGVLASFMMDYPGRVPALRILLMVASAVSGLTTVACVMKSTALLMAGSVGMYMFLTPVWSVLFLFTPESYPTHLRATAMGLFFNVDMVPGLVTPFLSAAISKGEPWHYIFTWTCILFANSLVANFWLKPNKHGYGKLESGSGDQYGMLEGEGDNLLQGGDGAEQGGPMSWNEC